MRDSLKTIPDSLTLGIIGSRKFTDWERFQVEMLRLPFDWGKVALIISGGIEGPVTMGELFADRHHIKTKLVRNSEIAAESDIIAAFWDGRRGGTQDTIIKAKIFKKPTIIIYV